MVFVDTQDVNTFVYNLIEGTIQLITGPLPAEHISSLTDSIKSEVGRFLGIRTEDGNERVYDVTLIEGEPYVYDQ